MAEANDDIILANDKNGTKKTIELVSKFDIEGLGKYVIYKLDGSFYGARYRFDGQKTNLEINLSDTEKEVLNTIFKKLVVE